jgi:hypothetical protein
MQTIMNASARTGMISIGFTMCSLIPGTAQGARADCLQADRLPYQAADLSAGSLALLQNCVSGLSAF